MMHINDMTLDRIETALHELLQNRQHIDLHPDDRAMLADAFNACTTVRESTATDLQLDAARDLIGASLFGDGLTIDDDACTSKTDEGYWIQAWLYVQTHEADAA